MPLEFAPYVSAFAVGAILGALFPVTYNWSKRYDLFRITEGVTLPFENTPLQQSILFSLFGGGFGILSAFARRSGQPTKPTMLPPLPVHRNNYNAAPPVSSTKPLAPIEPMYARGGGASFAAARSLAVAKPRKVPVPVPETKHVDLPSPGPDLSDVHIDKWSFIQIRHHGATTGLVQQPLLRRRCRTHGDRRCARRPRSLRSRTLALRWECLGSNLLRPKAGHAAVADLPDALNGPYALPSLEGVATRGSYTSSETQTGGVTNGAGPLACPVALSVALCGVGRVVLSVAHFGHVGAGHRAACSGCGSTDRRVMGV